MHLQITHDVVGRFPPMKSFQCKPVRIVTNCSSCLAALPRRMRLVRGRKRNTHYTKSTINVLFDRTFEPKLHWFFSNVQHMNPTPLLSRTTRLLSRTAGAGSVAYVETCGIVWPFHSNMSSIRMARGNSLQALQPACLFRASLSSKAQEAIDSSLCPFHNVCNKCKDHMLMETSEQLFSIRMRVDGIGPC